MGILHYLKLDYNKVNHPANILKSLKDSTISGKTKKLTEKLKPLKRCSLAGDYHSSVPARPFYLGRVRKTVFIPGTCSYTPTHPHSPQTKPHT